MPAYCKGDPDEIKAVRDHLTTEHFGKVYSDMDKAELTAMIAALQSGETIENQIASPRMLSTLKFYMMAVALEYANIGTWEYINKITGEEIIGEKLRHWLKRQFAESDKRLPEAIVRRLYTDWINPKSNTLLMEGEFKTLVRDPHKMWYERLKKKEVQYLIKRYAMIYDNKINKTVNNINVSRN